MAAREIPLLSLMTTPAPAPAAAIPEFPLQVPSQFNSTHLKEGGFHVYPKGGSFHFTNVV